MSTISVHRKVLKNPGIGGSKFGDHLFTHDINEANSYYALEAQDNFDLFGTSTGIFNRPLARYAVNTFPDKRGGGNHHYFTYINSFDDVQNVSLDGNLGYFRKAYRREAVPSGSRILYSIAKYRYFGERYGVGRRFRETHQLLTLGAGEVSAVLASDPMSFDDAGNITNNDFWQCSLNTDSRSFGDCRLGYVPNPSSSEQFAEEEIKADILASELPLGDGITVDYFELGTPNGMSGVDFFARNTLTGDDYAWLQMVEVSGSDSFPDRPFMDPMSDKFINGKEEISDNLPFYDLGNNFFTEDSPRYFADAENFDFTAQTLLVKKLDNNFMEFVDGVKWGYQINDGETTKKDLLALQESPELIEDFNQTLTVDFPDFELLSSDTSVPQSVPESLGIINLLLVACVLWRRALKS